MGKPKAKAEDYVGKAYGRWTVLSLLNHTVLGNTMVRCRCACGTERELKLFKLKSGHSKSCGCHKSEASAVRASVDVAAMIGKQFCNLVVREHVVRRNRANHFLCRCICGAEVVKSTNQLTRGKNLSCGCVPLSAPNKEDVTPLLGTRFGRLLVIEGAPAKKQKTQVLCVCACSTVVTVGLAALKKGGTKSCGCYDREQKSKRASARLKQPGGHGWRPQETPHGGVRSSYEAVLMAWLDVHSVEYAYEPQTFVLKDNVRYTPDFYLPSLDLWLELKGWAKQSDLEKLRLFAADRNVALLRWEDIRLLCELQYKHSVTYRKYAQGQGISLYAYALALFTAEPSTDAVSKLTALCLYKGETHAQS